VEVSRRSKEERERERNAKGDERTLTGPLSSVVTLKDSQVYESPNENLPIPAEVRIEPAEGEEKEENSQRGRVPPFPGSSRRRRRVDGRSGVVSPRERKSGRLSEDREGEYADKRAHGGG